MPGGSCNYSNCKNNRSNCKKKMYRFPTDRDTCRKWILNAGKLNTF